MIARVRLFANLVQYYPGAQTGKTFDVELEPGSTLADLVERLCLPRDQVKITFVNGIAHEQDFVLQPGDEVGIFPPVGGG